MKAIIASVGGRVPPAQNKRWPVGLNQWHLHRLTLAQYLIGLAQLVALTFQSFDPRSFLGRDPVAHATDFLSLLEPVAKGLANTANLGRNGRNRARLRFMRALMVKHHPNRTRARTSGGWRFVILLFVTTIILT